MSENITLIYEEPLMPDIQPIPSFVVLALVALFFLFLILARLMIRHETKNVDLILFNKSPQKHLFLLVSKQLYNNSAASNNIASAIAHGLMDAPGTILNNANSNSNENDTSTRTSITTLNSINADGNMKKKSSFENIEQVKSNINRQKW